MNEMINGLKPDMIKMPVRLKETKLDSGIKKTEVSGGAWDSSTMMYTTQEPSGIKTVYSFIPEFGVNRFSVKTESYQNGKQVRLEKNSGQWERVSFADKLKIEFARWKTIGHLESPKGEQLDVHAAGKADTKLVLVKYKNFWQRDSRTQLNTMYSAPQTR